MEEKGKEERRGRIRIRMRMRMRMRVKGRARVSIRGEKKKRVVGETRCIRNNNEPSAFFSMRSFLSIPGILGYPPITLITRIEQIKENE
jgi:hypothetical protein